MKNSFLDRTIINSNRYTSKLIIEEYNNTTEVILLVVFYVIDIIYIFYNMNALKK
jgi:hypothetical protein